MNLRYRFFLLTIGLFAGFTAAFYLFAYSQLGITKLLIVPAIILSLVLFIPPIVILINRGKTSSAGLLILVGLAIAYAGNEFTWQGLTIYNLIGGSLLIVLAGSFVLQRKYGLWISMVFFYVCFVFFLNSSILSSFTRYEISVFPLVFPFFLGANLLLGLAILAQILVEFQSRSIRTRLLATFVLLVFLPVVVIGGLTSAISASNAQQRVFDQLKSIVTLKSSEIATWTASLENEIQRYYPAENQIGLFEKLFSKPDNQPSEYDFTPVVSQLRQTMETTNLFDEIFFINPKGRIVLSTQEGRAGLDQSNTPYFRYAVVSLYRSGLYYSPTAGQNVVIVSEPIRGSNNQVIGVVAGRANLEILQTLMNERAGLGQTGETFLVTDQQVLLTSSLIYPGFVSGKSVTSVPIRQLIEHATDPTKEFENSGQYVSYQNKPVLGYYRWLPDLQLELFAEQQQTEALSSTYQSLLYTVIISVLSVIFAFGAGLYAAQRISRPLASLAATAQNIASGNLDLRADDSLVANLDEIGALSRSFNSMTDQLHTLVDQLEQRVADRTADLEIRSQQLQLAAETARDATTLRDLDELLEHGVQLIRDRFGFYQSAIYLIDLKHEAAVLASSSKHETLSEGIESERPLSLLYPERIQLNRNENHPLILGVIQSGQTNTVVHLNSRENDSVNNLKFVEAALPLRTAGRLIGVLDVQNREEINSDRQALDDSLLAVLQIVADQFGIAIESAQLLKQTRETLAELQVVYGNYTRSSWEIERGKLGESKGFHFDGLSVSKFAPQKRLIGDPSASSVYTIPLRLRNQQIGSIDLQFEGSKPGKEMIEVFEEISNRLSLLLENARLLQEAQRLAVREQELNRISTQMSSSINLDAILRNTVRQLGETFGAVRTFIQINPAFSSDQNQPENSEAMTNGTELQNEVTDNQPFEDERGDEPLEKEQSL